MGRLTEAQLRSKLFRALPTRLHAASERRQLAGQLVRGAPTLGHHPGKSGGFLRPLLLRLVLLRLVLFAQRFAPIEVCVV